MKKFENIDNFKSFFKKFKKSRYISTKDRKRLSDGDVSSDDFVEIQTKLFNAIELLKQIDIQDIKDLMVNADLEAPALIHNINVWFSLNIEPGKETTSKSGGGSNIFGTLDSFNIVVSKDSRNLPSKEHLVLDDNIDELTESLIDLIENKKIASINRAKERMGIDKVPHGKFDTNKWTHMRLQQTDHFRHIKINPQISIELDYEFPQKPDDGGYSDPNYQARYNINKYFESWVEKEVIGRMFKFLYIHKQFKVTVRENYYDKTRIELRVEIYILCLILMLRNSLTI